MYIYKNNIKYILYIVEIYYIIIYYKKSDYVIFYYTYIYIYLDCVRIIYTCIYILYTYHIIYQYQPKFCLLLVLKQHLQVMAPDAVGVQLKGKTHLLAELPSLVFTGKIHGF